ncbi:hypothetical protein ACFE04_010289 [Oxalis oulophora]
MPMMQSAGTQIVNVDSDWGHLCAFKDGLCTAPWGEFGGARAPLILSVNPSFLLVPACPFGSVAAWRPPFSQILEGGTQHPKSPCHVVMFLMVRAISRCILTRNCLGQRELKKVERKLGNPLIRRSSSKKGVNIWPVSSRAEDVKLRRGRRQDMVATQLREHVGRDQRGGVTDRVEGAIVSPHSSKEQWSINISTKRGTSLNVQRPS